MNLGNVPRVKNYFSNLAIYRKAENKISCFNYPEGSHAPNTFTEMPSVSPKPQTAMEPSFRFGLVLLSIFR